MPVKTVGRHHGNLGIEITVVVAVCRVSRLDYGKRFQEASSVLEATNSVGLESTVSKFPLLMNSCTYSSQARFRGKCSIMS